MQAWVELLSYISDFILNLYYHALSWVGKFRVTKIKSCPRVIYSLVNIGISIEAQVNCSTMKETRACVQRKHKRERGIRKDSQKKKMLKLSLER